MELGGRASPGSIFSRERGEGKEGEGRGDGREYPGEYQGDYILPSASLKAVSKNSRGTVLARAVPSSLCFSTPGRGPSSATFHGRGS